MAVVAPAAAPGVPAGDVDVEALREAILADPEHPEYEAVLAAIAADYAAATAGGAWAKSAI